MKQIKSLLLLIIVVGLCSCKDDTVTPTTSNEEPKKSQHELLSHKWILSETFIDGDQKTENGTGEYEFTTDGRFRFKSEQGTWSDIATYAWNDEDSISLSVIFTGSINTLHWNIETLNETELNTMFYSGGSQLHYKYDR